MLLKKLLWMKESENLDAEIRQCADEGKKIDDLIPLSSLIKEMPEGEEKESRAAALLLEMESRPVLPNFPYSEPNRYQEIRASLTGVPLRSALPKDQRREKLLGAWLGRAAGCTLGIPVEGWMRADIRGFLEESGQYPVRGFFRSDVPAAVREAYRVRDEDLNTPYSRKNVCWANNLTGVYPVDDDINYMLLALQIMEEHGTGFSSEDVAEAWLYGIPAMHACTAERVVYRNLLHRRMPPDSALYLNPFREWIGAQIRADLYGYVAAGDPMRASELAYRDASLSQTKNGLYAAMYTAALISAAAVLPDFTEAVQEALLCIPPESRLAEAIRRLLKDYSGGSAFTEVIDRLHDRYNEHDPFDWCLAIPNALIVTACVLWHGRSYADAVANAVLCGFDTDCNGATVGSVVGISLGAEAIGSPWRDALSPVLTSTVTGFSQISIEEAVSRTLRLMG